MKELVPYAEEMNVTLLIETNGVYADTKRLKKVLDAIGSRKAAALWDMHHPYRFMGESPEETVNNLGEYIKHVHVKDSVMVDGKVSYKLMGLGDMPLKEMFDALQSIDYLGYVSLEWVYRWSKDLENAGIVIPQFANYMETYRPQKKFELQTDKRGTHVQELLSIRRSLLRSAMCMLTFLTRTDLRSLRHPISFLLAAIRCSMWRCFPR